MFRLLSVAVVVTLSCVSAVDPSARICVQGGPVPPECPDNNRWNSVTCRFECLPAVDASPRVCIQGGPVPPECPDNNRWNSVTCRFECLPTETPICIQGGPVPAECPDNNRWNTETCRFECVPTESPICMIQGGAVPAECPNNNQWNSQTCRFECVCPQNQNCGINGVWDYDNCRCVVNTPATPAPTDRPICIQGGAVPAECPNNNQWNSQTCRFECLPHCVTNEGKFVFGGDRFYTKCNGCTCNADGSAACTRIGCDDAKCYDDAGRAYSRGATITRGCKTAKCVKDSNQQSVWKWVDPEAQQPPRCNFGPATFNKASCKWSCPKKCADGLAPPQCLVNPCATILCAANSQCVVNQCANYPNTENGPCTASCQPIVNCLVSPCSVNSCGRGQTCVDDYVGGCNYRCKDKFPL